MNTTISSNCRFEPSTDTDYTDHGRNAILQQTQQLRYVNTQKSR